MDVVIYREPQGATQSARGRAARWIVAPRGQAAAREPDSTMGWAQGAGGPAQVHLTFASRQAAEAHVQAQGWRATTLPPHDRPLVPRSYIDSIR
jgi:hypothetical protein